jgi:hypothetical protein
MLVSELTKDSYLAELIGNGEVHTSSEEPYKVDFVHAGIQMSMLLNPTGFQLMTGTDDNVISMYFNPGRNIKMVLDLFVGELGLGGGLEITVDDHNIVLGGIYCNVVLPGFFAIYGRNDAVLAMHVFHNIGNVEKYKRKLHQTLNQMAGEGTYDSFCQEPIHEFRERFAQLMHSPRVKNARCI